MAKETKVTELRAEPAAETAEPAAPWPPAWPRTFTWRGIHFAIDDPSNWPLKVLRAFEKGHTVDAIAGVIGDVAWSRVENMSITEAEELFNKITEVTRLGDKPGE